MNSQTDKSCEGVIVLLPVFNDWVAALSLVEDIKKALREEPAVRIVLVDDGSTQVGDTISVQNQSNTHCSVEIIRLVTNLGHQRAIAIGLAAIEAEGNCEAIVVMDADGEDMPEHITRLLGEMRASDEQSVVFARRNRRTEGWLFKLGYACFKIFHRMLTGKACDVGNFCAIPGRYLPALTHSTDLWNHFAATVIASRLPVKKVDCERGRRYAGQSKMSLASLVGHGLRAISVFGEIVGVRVGMALGLSGAAAALALVAVVVTRFFTDLAIPGWATTAVGILLILCLNLLILTAMSLMFSIAARSNTEFVPARDWNVFVDSWRQPNE